MQRQRCVIGAVVKKAEPITVSNGGNADREEMLVLYGCIGELNFFAVSTIQSR